MSFEGLSVQIEREPSGRWVAKIPEEPALSASSETAAGALHAFADQLEKQQVRERFGAVMERMREQARRGGLQLSDEEIEAEIRAVRAERSKR